MTRGWYSRAGIADEQPSEGDRFLAEQGQRIGRLARELHPEGVLIPLGDAAFTQACTNAAMRDPSVNTIFEGTFVVDDYVARADILRRTKGGWEIAEVKMSLAGTDRLAELIDDLAYTVLVARRSGAQISRASLILLSRDYRRGSPKSQMFVEIDQTREVESRMAEYESLWEPIRFATAAETPPAGKLISDCRGCEFFESGCLGNGIEDHVFHLPSLHSKKVVALSASGVVSLSALPAKFPLTDIQQRAVKCVQSKAPYVARLFKHELEAVEWPVRYLDFETVMTASPLYDGIAPFEQVVTQFSVHTCSAPGVIVNHAEYLAEAERDCQRDLAERILTELGDQGSIVVYSSFESVRISALASRFPDLHDRLLRLKDRLVDLLPIVRRGFYHHQLRGSFSIKRLLPAVVPEMSYDGLWIADGGAAVAHFARMALGEYEHAEIERTREHLLAYCRQDTLAMVRLHAALLAI